jgi:hypothetical protein
LIAAATAAISLTPPIQESRMRLATLLALSVALLLSSCTKASAGESAKAATDLFEKIVVQLESAKDEASAKAAAVKLEPLVAAMKEMKPQLDQLAKGAEPDAATKAKYEPIMNDLRNRMMQAGMRIASDEKIQAALGPTMEKMNK